MDDDDKTTTSSPIPSHNGETGPEASTTPGSPASPSTPTEGVTITSGATEPRRSMQSTGSAGIAPPEPLAPAPGAGAGEDVSGDDAGALPETDIWYTDPIQWKGMDVLVCKVCGWRTVKGVEAVEAHVYGRHAGTDVSEIATVGRSGLVGPDGRPL